MTEANRYELEIQMHAFRLMRDSGLRTAEEIKTELLKAFPDVPKEQVLLSMRELCRRMLANY